MVQSSEPSPPLYRRDLESLTPYAHALDLEEVKKRHGLSRIIKMGSNECPYGPLPAVAETLRDLADGVARYPQPDNAALIRAIAEYYDVPPECIVVGNGLDEVIDLLVRVRNAPGEGAVLAATPCFDVYRLSSILCGTPFRQTPLTPDFHHDFSAFKADVGRDVNLVFITNPNNPTGVAETADAIRNFATAIPPETLVAVDEAYIDFADDVQNTSVLPRLHETPNLCVLRTFSKALGMAGLRLGVGFFPAPMAEMMRRAQIPFSVNIMAQAAGMAVLKSMDEVAKRAADIRNGREILYQGMKALGCDVLPSQANFLMFKPPRPAEDVFDELLAKGYLLRKLSPGGMPQWLRISVGTDEENQGLLATLKNIL